MKKLVLSNFIGPCRLFHGKISGKLCVPFSPALICLTSLYSVVECKIIPDRWVSLQLYQTHLFWCVCFELTDSVCTRRDDALEVTLLSRKEHSMWKCAVRARIATRQFRGRVRSGVGGFFGMKAKAVWCFSQSCSSMSPRASKIICLCVDPETSPSQPRAEPRQSRVIPFTRCESPVLLAGRKNRVGMLWAFFGLAAESGAAQESCWHILVSCHCHWSIDPSPNVGTPPLANCWGRRGCETDDEGVLMTQQHLTKVSWVSIFACSFLTLTNCKRKEWGCLWSARRHVCRSSTISRTTQHRTEGQN